MAMHCRVWGYIEYHPMQWKTKVLNCLIPRVYSVAHVFFAVTCGNFQYSVGMKLYRICTEE